MVKVFCKQKDPKDNSKWIEVELYLDGYIKSNLDAGIDLLHKDFDQVWFVDGVEGGGKSDLAATCAYYVNKEETRHTLTDRICPTAEAFEAAIMKAEKYEAVVLDEGFGGMSSTGTMAKINRVLQRRFTEIRAKNLFVFILAPSFMDIMRYFAIWRSKCLLHVYLGEKSERGYGAFFNDKRKKKLYILGKKQFYNYSVVPANFTFRFIKQMHKVIDKEKYDKNKEKWNLNRIEEKNPQQLARELLVKVISNIEKHERMKDWTYKEKGKLFGKSEKWYDNTLYYIRKTGGLDPET